MNKAMKKYTTIKEMIRRAAVRNRANAFLGVAPVSGKALGLFFGAEYFFNFFQNKFNNQLVH